MADKAETIVETPVEAPVEAALETVAAEAPAAAAPEAAVVAAPEAALEVPKLRKPRKAAAPKIAKPAVAKAPRVPKAKKAPAKAAPMTVKTTKPKTAKLKTAKPKAAATKAALSFPTFSKIKDTIMATKTTDFTKTINDVVADAQEKAKTAYAQGTAAFGEAGEFAKGNVEAVVESGKILATGLKELGGSLVEEGKAAFETISADVKELTAIKSPADLLKLQSEIMRRNFDAAVAFGSKNTEAMMKLVGDAAAPISTRVSLAVAKVKKAA